MGRHGRDRKRRAGRIGKVKLNVRISFKRKKMDFDQGCC